MQIDVYARYMPRADVTGGIQSTAVDERLYSTLRADPEVKVAGIEKFSKKGLTSSCPPAAPGQI